MPELTRGPLGGDGRLRWPPHERVFSMKEPAALNALKCTPEVFLDLCGEARPCLELPRYLYAGAHKSPWRAGALQELHARQSFSFIVSFCPGSKFLSESLKKWLPKFLHNF